MFGSDKGTWEIVGQDGSILAWLIISGACLLLAMGMIVLAYRAIHAWDDLILGVVFVILTVFLLLVAFITHLGAFGNIELTNDKQAREAASAQIEQKYNLEVESLKNVKIEGGERMRSEGTHLVNGILSATTNTDDGNWHNVEFKYSFVKGQEVMLFPMDDESKESKPADPNEFLR